MSTLTSHIETAAQFSAYVEEMRAEFSRSPEAFEAMTIDDLLKGLAAWVADSGGYYRSIGESSPSPNVWRYVADAVTGAMIYE